jgi:hypothetical protein
MPYPVGPVAYLRAHEVRANVLVPFGVGAFISWKLHPSIKVSLDSRYEAAFRPELLVTHLDFFAARDGWRRFLEAHPTDLVLALTTAPIVRALATRLRGRSSTVTMPTCSSRVRGSHSPSSTVVTTGL